MCGDPTEITPDQFRYGFFPLNDVQNARIYQYSKYDKCVDITVMSSNGNIDSLMTSALFSIQN